ncbi:hypothetical protein M2189_002081 [Bradyrhizobium japonicum]|nr:hypothetical protein [Bradyrhizobium japonicum]MCS3958878.1 hypothetical protein [Bradyrhizobium japonicum]MCS4000633.1 hypothetical protein [Bradyrhizobium japonicum]
MVWEGRSREASPYPDFREFESLPLQDILDWPLKSNSPMPNARYKRAALINYDEFAPAITQKNAANRRLARQTRSRKLLT